MVKRNAIATKLTKVCTQTQKWAFDVAVTQLTIKFDCSTLTRRDGLYWIGLHDVNSNGEQRWAESGKPPPRPVPWYERRPAGRGELTGCT